MPRYVASRPSSAIVAVAALIVVAFLLPCNAEIRYTEIQSDDRPIIPLDDFGFTHRGQLELRASRIVLDPHPKPDPEPPLTNIGFFLCTRDSWFNVLKQLQDSDITCALQSSYIKQVYKLDRLRTGWSWNKSSIAG